MIKISKNREKYLLEKYFDTKNKKNSPSYLSQFGCRDSDLTDEDLFFITQYATHIDRLAIGGSFVTEEGLQCLKKLKHVEYLDLRSMPLNDDNVNCILHLENLEYLYIKFTEITASGISKILQACPKLKTLVAEVSEEDNEIVDIWKKKRPETEFILSLK